MAGPRPAPVASSTSWPRLVLAGLRTFWLAACGALVLWVGLGALVAGLDPVVITSGSMSPGIRPGDVVLTAPPGADAPAPGTVATFRDPGTPGRLVTHRVAEVRPDGRLVTRGDANPAPDTTPVEPSSIVGVGRLLVPMVGLPVVWVQDGQWVHLAVLVLATLGALVVSPGREEDAPTHAGVARGRPADPSRHVPVPPTTVGAASGPVDLPRVWHARQPAGTVTAGTPRRQVVVPTAARAAVVLAALVLAAAVTAAPARAWQGVAGSAGNSWQAGTAVAPTGVSATGGCRLLVLGPKVDVSWTAAAGATGYRVLRSSTSGGPYTQVGTVGNGATTTWTDTGVSTNRTYHYVVRSVAGTWVSGNSTQASATTPALCL